MQVFFGILVQHFAMLASQYPIPMSRLDVLTSALASMVGEVPFYAATVARARLTQLHELLSAALNDPVAAIEGPSGTCWPPTRFVPKLARKFDIHRSANTYVEIYTCIEFFSR